MVRAAFICVATMLLLNAARAATFTVINTNNLGVGSLYWAMTNANATAGLDTIAFNIPGAGPHTIRPTASLPTIVDPVTIDGYTQPGASANTLPQGNNAVLKIRIDGSAAGNSATGIQVNSGGTTIRGMCIVRFGTGNSSYAINLNGQSGNVVQGNFLGIDVDGVTVQGNGAAGIRVSGAANLIGGTAPGERNVISGNGKMGVLIIGSNNNLVRGNYIGTDASGQMARGNVGTGIQILNASSFSNIIGGTLTGAGNVISGNGGNGNDPHGIFLDKAIFTVIEGNFIGTDCTGSAPLPNVQHGIFMDGADVNSNRVGSVTLNAGNRIWYNGVSGVMLRDGVANSIRGNSIHANGALGIDIYSDGVTANDAGDGDSGPNGRQNFPVLSEVYLSGPNIIIHGVLNSKNSTTYEIDFYSSPTNDPTGYGEGVTYLGSITRTTSSSGSVALNATLPGTVTVGHYVTATATDPSGNTSEFSLARQHNPAYPVITGMPESASQAVGSTVTLSVTATASPAPFYQWLLNGATIPGATNATFVINNLQATNGGSYSVMVGNVWGVEVSDAVTVLATNVPALPVQDNFAARPLVTLPSVSRTNNFNATEEINEPRHFGVRGGGSVWFRWTAPSGGIVTLSTRGSDFDTILAVYTGSDLMALNEVISDDDSGGYHTSLVKFNVTGGTTYHIAVDGRFGARGSIVLSYHFENTLDLLPLLIPPPPPSLSVGLGEVVEFLVQLVGGPYFYQWFRNDVAIAGATSSGLTRPNVSAADVGFYTVRVRNLLGREVFSRPATLQINMTDGINIPGVVAYNKFQDLAEVVRSAAPQFVPPPPPPNYAVEESDEPGVIAASGGSGAGPARGYTGTQIFSTYKGSSQPGEPVKCGVPGGASAWVAYQAEADGTLEIKTDGSTFDTLLAVYTGSGESFESLESVACDNNSGGNGVTSKVVFSATAGTIYWIAVDGVNGAWGTVMLTYNLQAAPVVTVHPLSAAVAAGASKSLAVAAKGNPAPICQWVFNNAIIVGATNSTLTFTNFSESQAGHYYAYFTNTMGQTATVVADLVPSGPLRFDQWETLANGQLRMRMVGSPNTSYVIQASTNLTHWVPVKTNTPASGLWLFTDPFATNYANRFYRAVPGS